MQNDNAITGRKFVSRRSEQWITFSAVATMLIVAISSAVLSFDGLRRLALASSVPEELAFLFPITIDATILMGSLAVLRYELYSIRTAFGWFTVIFGTALSVVGNVISVNGTGVIAQVLHGIIPILLCISLESLLRILRFNIRRQIEQETPAQAFESGTQNSATNFQPEPLRGLALNSSTIPHVEPLFQHAETKQVVEEPKNHPVPHNDTALGRTPEVHSSANLTQEVPASHEAPVPVLVSPPLIQEVPELGATHEDSAVVTVIIEDVDHPVAGTAAIPASAVMPPAREKLPVAPPAPPMPAKEEVEVQELPSVEIPVEEPIASQPSAQKNKGSSSSGIKDASPVTPSVISEPTVDAETRTPASASKSDSLSEKEVEILKGKVANLAEGMADYKKLGVILSKLKRNLSHKDIRLIMGYPANKRVDTLVKKAKDVAETLNNKV